VGLVLQQGYAVKLAAQVPVGGVQQSYGQAGSRGDTCEVARAATAAAPCPA
jgi:hypothetical protein